MARARNRADTWPQCLQEAMLVNLHLLLGNCRLYLSLNCHGADGLGNQSGCEATAAAADARTRAMLCRAMLCRVPDAANGRRHRGPPIASRFTVLGIGHRRRRRSVARNRPQPIIAAASRRRCWRRQPRSCEQRIAFTWTTPAIHSRKL